MIALNSVTKKFGTSTTVDNITCHIEKDEYFALLGPNGAGKTTMVLQGAGLRRFDHRSKQL